MKRAVVEEIKSRLPLLDLVMGYIQVEQAGKNYRAKCPFHSEKTASFYISPERDSYYCFGCGKKGDIFSFVEEYEGLDFKSALKTFAERTHVDLKDSYSETHEKSDKGVLYQVLEDATTFFEKKLQENIHAKEYVESRGLNKNTIEVFRIGYAPTDWKELTVYLKSKNYTDELIEKAGLGKVGNYGLYDRFRDRIMFPFTDSSGRIIGFSGRIVTSTDKEAKYINSPETPLFKKGSVFFGMAQAKDAIRTKKKVLIVEGQMDVCMTFQSGVQFVVGSSGTAFSGDLNNENYTASSHLGIIRRFTDRVYFAFDNDKAGLKAMYKAVEQSLISGFTSYCLVIEGNKDPADIALKDPKAMSALIQNAVPSILYFISVLLNTKDQRTLRKGIHTKIWPLVVLLKSPIEESHTITQIAQMVHIDEHILIDDYGLYKKNLKKSTKEEVLQNGLLEKETITSTDRIYGLLFFLESHKDQAKVDTLIREILKVISEGEHEVLYKERLERKEELIFHIEKSFSNSEVLEKDITFTLHHFEKEYYQNKLKNIKNEIDSKSLDIQSMSQKLEEVVRISKKLKK